MIERDRRGPGIEIDETTAVQKIFYKDPITPDRIKSLLEMSEEAF